MKTPFCGWLVKAFKKEIDSPKHQQFVVCAKVTSGRFFSYLTMLF
jgi:hypothetical protein